MSFLRRIFGGGDAGRDGGRAEPTGRDGAQSTIDPEADDAARERELLAEEARRLSDDLLARQMRYADRSWTPPAQGGTRRAEDADGTERD